MTHHDRMMAALARGSSDRIPWAPRMDLWYIANRARGSLPAGFEGLDTVGIARKLGVGCHAVRADFTLPRPREDLILRGFGLDNHRDYPFRLELRGLPCSFEHDGEGFSTRIETRSGALVTRLVQSREMGAQGISLPFVLDYPLTYPARMPGDLEAVAEVFEHIEVIPAPEAYLAFKERVGDQGLAVAQGLNVASPMHLLLHDLMPMNDFFLRYMDEPESLRSFAARLEPFFERVLEVSLASACEVLWWGANYDQTTTYPAFFEREIAPWLSRAGRRAEAAGRRLLTHADGENRLLLPLYRDAGFHVAESVCAAPMTELSLRDFREGAGPRVTTWGGIPAVALLPESMTEKAFEGHLDRLFGELGDARGLILGVSDNVPPDASLARLERIGRRIEDHGPVGPP